MPPHQVLPDPQISSLCTLPLSFALAKVQVSKKVHLITISKFKIRFIEPAWQSQGFVGSRKHQCLSSAPTILGLCLKCPLNWRMAKWHSAHWEWMALLGMERGHPSKNYSVLVPYLIWGRQSVLALNNGPTLLDQLPALLCDIALQRGNL